MFFLQTGSSRRAWSSWSTGLAWSKCKFLFIPFLIYLDLLSPLSLASSKSLHPSCHLPFPLSGLQWEKDLKHLFSQSSFEQTNISLLSFHYLSYLFHKSQSFYGIFHKSPREQRNCCHCFFMAVEKKNILCVLLRWDML